MILDDSHTRNTIPMPSTVRKDMDIPPPYDNPPLSRQAASPSTSTQRRAPTRDRAPPPSVNQVHLQGGHKGISGTFFVDPRIPSLGFESKDKNYQKSPPHASFRTRKGPILLNLATTGNVREVAKATILVGSRSGDIRIKLLHMPPTRPHIGLDVYSRQGDIVLLIPRTFAGVIQLSTSKGSIQMLPAFRASTKTLKEVDHEALVLIGDQNAASAGDPRVADFCQLNSRFGKVVVGIDGEDNYVSEAGFWKKLGGYLRGSSSS